MASDSEERARPPRVSLAIPAGPLRRRLLDLLSETDVEVEILEDPDVVQGVQDSDSDVVVVDPGNVTSDDMEALGEIARDGDEAGLAVIGEEDPGARARLLAAGFSSVLSGTQDAEDLAVSLEALAEAEAAGGITGPDVRGSDAQPRLADFLTRSPRMKEFVQLVQRVIAVDTSLLILGPTGVGKEHLARAIHCEGPRADGPFVSVNCAALPEQLLEAELFGHRRGAFTGAASDRRGHFERASGGTLFLDEIGEMPVHLQVKLLTVLQRHEVTPVGAEQPVRVDVRVVGATNRDLEREIENGRFREDLYYRLNVVPLVIPSLAERPQDIPDFVGRFIQHFRSAMPETRVETISDRAIDALMRYPWPGNVRQLINVVERSILLTDGTEIDVDSFPPAILQGPTRTPSQDSSSRTAHAGLPVDWLGLSMRELRERAVEWAETAYLRVILQKTQGRVGEAAKAAGLSTRALHERMKKRGLKKEDFKG